MPIYKAKLSDGRTITVEADQEPTEDEILSAAESYDAQPQQPDQVPQALVPPALGPDLLPTAREAAGVRDTLAIPATGFGVELKERAGDVFRGALRIVPSALRSVGAVLAKGSQPADPMLSGGIAQTEDVPPETIPIYQAGQRGEAMLEELFPPPQEPELARSVGEGFGQLGAMLAGGAATRTLGAAMPVATATTMGGVMEFDDAYQRSRQRGDDPDTALAKSLGYSTVASLIENRLGAGRLLRQLFPSVKEGVRRLTAMGVSKNILKNFVAGGVEEGSQRFAQNWIVEGEPSMEGVTAEALPGAIVEGVFGLPGAVIQAGAGRRGQYALEQEAAQPVRPVREQPGEGPRQVPGPQAGPQIDEGGGVIPPAPIPTPVAPPALPAPAEKSPEEMAGDIGWTYQPTAQAGALKLEGLTPEQQAQLLAAQPQQWEFTDRREESPSKGFTFYVPVGATQEQIQKRSQEMAGNAIAELLGAEFRGIAKNGLLSFEAKKPDGTPSTGFHVKAGATVQEAVAKYQEVLDRYKDDPANAPRPIPQPKGGVESGLQKEGQKETVTVTAPEAPAPTPPKPPILPKGVPEEQRSEAFQKHRLAMDQWEKDLEAWTNAQPEDKPLIFKRPNGSYYTISPNIGGGWRVTTWTHPWRDMKEVAPWGHTVFTTRFGAVKSIDSDMERVDKLPPVLTETDLAAETAKRNKAAQPTPEPVSPTQPKQEITEADVQQWLAVPVPDVADQQARMKIVNEDLNTLNKEYGTLDQERKALEKEVLIQRGPRYKRGQLKQSASSKKVQRWREIQQRQNQIMQERAAIETHNKAASQAVELASQARWINDKSRPLVSRMVRAVNLWHDQHPGQNAPAEMIQARDALIYQELRKAFPDATDEELFEMRNDAERNAYFGDPVTGAALGQVLDIQAKRRNQLRKGIKAVRNEYIRERKPFYEVEQPTWTQTQPLAPGDVTRLINEYRKAVETRAAEEAETQRKAAEEAAKRKAEEDKLLAEAEAQVASGRDKGLKPKSIKESLVGRIWAAIEDLVAASDSKFTRKEIPEGETFTEYVIDGAQASMGEVEPTDKGRFVVTVRRLGDKDTRIKATVDSIEEAETILKAMASEGPGNAIVAVPGDGIFRLVRSGARLLETWTKAKAIKTTSGTERGPSTAKGETPPSEIKTVQGWVDAKEFHGLEPNDKISTWSNALEALAKRINPSKPKEVTTKDVDDWIEEKFKRKGAVQAEEQARKQAQEAPAEETGPAESRIETEEAVPGEEERIGGDDVTPQNLWELDDTELAGILEAEWGVPLGAPGELAFGRRGAWTFPSYEKFRDWMDARYAERDLEGMKLAFAEADTKSKIRYIKEQKDANDHKKAWVNHLGDGRTLPADDPPRPRTTPRPGPDGRVPTPSPGPTPPGAPPTTPRGPARPAPPPPPPRPPTVRRKFDLMALVQLARQFKSSPARFPSISKRLRDAYGHYIPSQQIIELMDKLTWDTALAERVLAHEIGHFLDLAVQMSGFGKDIHQRLRPLWDFSSAFHRRLRSASDLQNEAINLSAAWRGPFTRNNKYRMKATELFADFISAMLNSPEWVNQNYPKLFDAFQDVLDTKPQMKSAYREVETWLQGGTMAEEFVDQEVENIKRTDEELLKPRERSKANFWDRLKFATMSLWGRAYEKEGKPRELGASIADDLEYSTTWSATQDALLFDDFLKDVVPHLEKISEDPIQARAFLSSYSQAIRTLGERRAAGKWIETNPGPARALLQNLLAIDPALRAEFIGKLNSASDAELYDLSAAIFRVIHQRGKPFVDRISKVIDRLRLGVKGQAALMAFNVRGKLLNPGGLTPQRAEEVLLAIQRRLSPAQYGELEQAASALRDLMFEAQSNMYNEGLIPKKIWEELIVPNRDNYLPYAVLDYFEGHVRAGVIPQIGTAKPIADVIASTALKIASINVWRQKQRQVQLIREAYRRGGVNVAPGKRLKRASDIEQIKAREKDDDVSRAVLWVDGKPRLVEFPGDVGKLLEKAMENKAFYEHIGWIAEASNVTHKFMQLYTQLSVSFMLWRNWIRGLRTAALRLGFRGLGKQVGWAGREVAAKAARTVGLHSLARGLSPTGMQKSLALARNYAAAAFGAEMLPEVRQLVEQQVILPPRLSSMMVRDVETLKGLMARNLVMANQIRKIQVGKPRWWKGGSLVREAVKVSEKLFTAYEAFEKIYNYNAALSRGLSPAKAKAIARRGGIPKPGVGGKWSLAMEVWFPWTRVHLQGLRSTWDAARDPELGTGFAVRFALTEALPRVAKVAIGMGIVSGAIIWKLRPDEDDDDPVMAEFLKRVSPYKMALDDIVPLYFYDPRTGKVHYIWEFKAGKEVPKHYESVSLRLPASEEGRLWGVMLYQMMLSAPEANKQLGKPGNSALENLGGWAVNYLVPQLSPMLEVGKNLSTMVATGRNPEDPYRGQPAANPMLFEAGGPQRAEAIAGYLLNQGGSFGQLGGVLAANMGLLDERALQNMSRRLPTDYSTWNDKIPFLNTAVSHDNYGQYREEKQETLEREKLNRRARLLMPEEPRALYDYYYRNLKRKDKMTDKELEMFEEASAFVNDVWGDLTIEGEPNPDSFYSKAAHAVSPDGSKQVKETFKRDLNTAAGPYIERFRQLSRETP